MTNEPRRGISGKHADDGRPKGYSSLTPFIVVSDPAAALRFYETVFKAQIRGVVEMTVDGKRVVAHAEVVFPFGVLQLGGANPAYGLVLPPTDGHVCYSIALYVTDVDAVVQRAEQNGATVRERPTDFVSGDRFASILDPVGIRWSIMSRVEDLSYEESEARVLEWSRSLG
jgi:uncharacterized glyoxalase superfamily protein PhnB